MNVFGLIWRALHALGFVVVSLRASEVEFDGNYADDYDNEISQDQQEDASPAPFHAADFSRWDQLFIALEDSHMKQNMLLESAEQCRGGMARLGAQVDELAKGVGAACRAQAERVGARLQRETEELGEEEAERGARLNATLRALLSGGRGGGVWLKRLEEDRGTTATPVTALSDAAAKERALVAVTTELEKVHLLLTRVITQVEALRRDRGDV